MRRGVAWQPRRSQPRMLDYLEHPDEHPEVQQTSESAVRAREHTGGASLPPAQFIDHTNQRIRPIQRSQRVPAPAYQPMLAPRPRPMVTLGPGEESNPFPFSTQVPDPQASVPFSSVAITPTNPATALVAYQPPMAELLAATNDPVGYAPQRSPVPPDAEINPVQRPLPDWLLPPENGPINPTWTQSLASARSRRGLFGRQRR